MFNPDEEVKFLKWSCENMVIKKRLRMKIAVLRLLFAHMQGLNVVNQIKEAAIILKKTLPLCGDWVSQWKFAAGLIGQVVECQPSQGKIAEGSIVGIKGKRNSLKLALGAEFYCSDRLGCLFADGILRRIAFSDITVFSDETLKQLCKEKGISENSQWPAVLSYTPFGEGVQEMIDILNSKIPTKLFKMTAEDSRLVQKSSGIVIGSFTTIGKSNSDKSDDEGELNVSDSDDEGELNVSDSDDEGELNVSNPQVLGKDLQVIFADDDRVDEVRNYISQQQLSIENVHIVGLQALTYIVATTSLPWKHV
jgi:hypothetical protein